MYAFIDESGDHSLDVVSLGNNYSVFVLGVILIMKKDYRSIDNEFKKIKKEIFGDEEFIVHTKELAHPYARRSDPRNKIICDPLKRGDFYRRINSLIENSSIKGCYMVIDKRTFKRQYIFPADPYELSFENLLNRIMYYSKSDDIEIYLECRNPLLDKKISAEFAKYSVKGTIFHTANEIKRRIKKFEFRGRTKNITGLQIADLLVNPVGRHFLGLKPKPQGNEVSYQVVKKKFAGTEKLSLTVFP